ncbi:hypothetical protein BH09PLA1_BH09PLA1_09060 [soil metagenome]
MAKNSSRRSALYRSIEQLESRLLLADAVLVKDIFAGPDSSVSFASEYTRPAVLGNKIIFAAIDEAHGSEVWISDGTAAGTTLLKDLNPGPGSSRPYGFTAGNGVVYFGAAEAGLDTEVWRTDGTPGGTVKLTNAASDVAGFHYNSGNFYYTLFNNPGVFSINDSGSQGTVSASLDSVSWIGDVGGIAVFEANDPTVDDSLWATTGGGATLVIDPSDLGTASFTRGTVVNGQLVFGMTWQHNGTELWRTNGTAAGTALIADINPGVFNSSTPQNFVTVGSSAFFTAQFNDTDRQIYKTDGATATKVTSLPNATFRELVNVNGTLFFSYQDAGLPFQLYKLAGGTTATPVIPGSAGGGGGAGYLLSIGANVYFAGLDSSSKSRLFVSDGTTIAPVSGDAGFNPSGLTNFNGTLIYQADDDAHGAELHALSGGGGNPNPTPFNVRLKIHENAQKHTNVIDEGESLTFEAVTTGPAVEKIYWDFGDGNLIYLGKGKKPTHDYPDNFATPTVNVRIKVKPAGEDKFYNASIPLTVNNLKPVIKVTMPRAFVAYAPMPFFGSVTDPDVKNGKIKNVEINFDDGTISTVAVNSGGYFSGVKIWTSRQLLGRTVRITANDGDISKTKKQTVFIDDIVPADPLDAANQALGLFNTLVGGTSGDDRIQIKHEVDEDGIENIFILMGLTNYAIIDPANSPPIVVYAGDGNDRVDVDADVTKGIKIYGGSGNDTLRGGAGRDTLYGQGGSDSLDGRGGKNTVKQ